MLKKPTESTHSIIAYFGASHGHAFGHGLTFNLDPKLAKVAAAEAAPGLEVGNLYTVAVAADEAALSDSAADRCRILAHSGYRRGNGFTGTDVLGMNSPNESADFYLRLGLHHECATETRGYVTRIDVAITGRVVRVCNGAVLEELVIGNALLRHFHVENAVDDGGTILTAFTGSRSNRKAGAALFDYDREEYLPAVTGRYKGFFGYGDVLLVDRLTVEPFARGHQLGLAVLDRVIRDWSKGCDLVVLKPFPLQFESDARDKADWARLALAAYSQSRDAAFVALKGYYARLGFEPVGEGDYFALAAEEYVARPQPVRPIPDRLPVCAAALGAWLRLSSQGPLLASFNLSSLLMAAPVSESKSAEQLYQSSEAFRAIEPDEIQSLVI